MISDFDPQPVYRSLKDGTFVKNINSFSAEQLQPFVPALLRALSSNSMISVNSDVVRHRLLQFPQCKMLHRILTVDATGIKHALDHATANDLENICQMSFETASAEMKVKIVAFWLERMKRKIVTNNLDIFEQDSFLEEVICAIIVCALYMPDRFDPPLITHFLLPLPKAVIVITTLICNMMDSLEPTVDYLLRSDLFEDDSIICKNRSRLLLKLLSVDPSLVEPSVAKLLNADNENSNEMALMVMCTCLNNTQLVNNLLCALLNKHSLGSFIHRSSNKPVVKLLQKEISDIVNVSSANAVAGMEASIAQLLAILCIIANLSLSCDEAKSWLLFLTRVDVDDDRYRMTALSAIIACPQLMPTNLSGTKEVEDSLILFLNCLKQHTSSNVSSALQQFFILVSIHLHAEQSERLAALVSNVLSFKVTINVKNLNTVKSLFLRHIMTEYDIAERAAQMPVTYSLNFHHQGFLPAHCIAQLLSTNSFCKHSVSIEDWIGAQIINCSTPLHPVITDLLQAYAASCFPSADDSSVNRPLSEEFILELFSGEVMDENKIVSRILTFYFFLHYRKHYESHLRRKEIHYIYSDQVEAVIPVRFLLNVVEAQPEHFRAIRSSLIRLCGLYYSCMLPTVDFTLSVQYELNHLGPKTTVRNSLSTALLLEAFNKIESNPADAIHFVRLLQKSTLREQLQAKDAIVHAMALALNPFTPAAFSNGIVALWRRLENVVPRSLCEATVCAWCTEKLTHKMLVEQPLFLLRCDERLFENDILFPCYLRILTFYMSANRAFFLHKLQMSQSGREDQRTELEELTRSMIGIQESSVVLILLEICGRYKNVAVHRLCCGHIHQMFIADPILIKLVHFQGYPLRLIPLAVREIPSMHICLEFVHEILALPDNSKRAFAIVLITELAQQYNIESSFIRVELVLDVLTTLCRALTTDEYLLLMLQVVPSLGRMMPLFPQISADVALLLTRTSAIAVSRQAVSATVMRTDGFEKQLITLIDNVLSKTAADMALVKS